MTDVKTPGMNYQIQSSLNLNSDIGIFGFSSKIFTSKPNLTLKILEKFQSRNDNVSTIYYKNENFDENSEAVTILRPNTQNTLFRDEGYESFGMEIWDIVSKQPRNKHFLWEYFDNRNITLEKPFACETDLNTVPLFKSIIKQNCLGLLSCNNISTPPLMISSNNFIKYVKYMLVGTVSVIFLVDDQGIFYLKDRVCIEDLSEEIIKSYCSDLIFCGSCFRSLSQLCETYTSIVKNCGYVFKVSYLELSIISSPITE